MRLLLGWLLAILALAGSPALGALPARPDGPVLDQANVIPDAQEAALDQRLRAYTAATGRSVVVATVNSLDGLPAEDYAQKLSESWDIGGKQTEEGVLLLVAPGDRALRIHNARGVQDRLTDALSGRIIRDTMVPRFKAGDFGGGIIAGVDGIIAQLDRSPADAKAVAEAAAAAAKNTRGNDGASFGSVIFWVVLILFFAFLFGGRRNAGRRSGIDPAVVLWGVAEVASHMGRRDHGGFGGFGGGSDSGGGFGGFGGGGGGFDGGGASGDW